MPESITVERTAFVTFYSFKGGVGRSMALINVAGILAGRGFKVLALDMDLEAPGISYLMRHASEQDDALLPGFVDLLHDACERGEEADLFALNPQEVVEKYSYSYEIPEEIRHRDEGFLRIMPAGQFDGSYQSRLDELDLGRLYHEGQGRPLVAAFKKVVADAACFDFVFIDSRTGFSDESGICTRDLGDHLVVVMGLNRQNQEGTAEFLRSLRQSDSAVKSLRVVLSPVPHGEDELVDACEKQAAEMLEKAWGEHLDLSLQIPYHPRLALTEEPHIFRRSRGYLYEAYAEIERTVAKMMGLDPERMKKRIAADAGKKRGDAVLHQLRTLAKLDNGAEHVASLVHQLRDLICVSEGQVLAAFLAETLPKRPWGLQFLASELHRAKQPAAELFYQRAIEADPQDADHLGNFANFLTDIRKDHDAAEELYRRAIDADPQHANNLGNFAVFLTDIRKDHDAAEELYRRAIDADPQDATFLGNFANFLTDIRKDHDAAEELYRRAIEADPQHANILGNFANFFTNIRKDHDTAEELYRRAIDADPQHADHLGNFAKLLFLKKRIDEAESMLERAWQNPPLEPPLQCELHFYACAHAWQRHPEALSELKRLLESGARSEGWVLDENVRVARESGHPHPDFIAALADVVSGKSGIETLADFEPWQSGSFSDGDSSIDEATQSGRSDA